MRLVLDEGKSVGAVARDLDLTETALREWVKRTQADLALFDVSDARELPYWYGDQRCAGSWVRGRVCHSSTATTP